jgi:hypothetical protein
MADKSILMNAVGPCTTTTRKARNRLGSGLLTTAPNACRLQILPRFIAAAAWTTSYVLHAMAWQDGLVAVVRAAVVHPHDSCTLWSEQLYLHDTLAHFQVLS